MALDAKINLERSWLDKLVEFQQWQRLEQMQRQQEEWRIRRQQQQQLQELWDQQSEKAFWDNQKPMRKFYSVPDLTEIGNEYGDDGKGGEKNEFGFD